MYCEGRTKKTPGIILSYLPFSPMKAVGWTLLVTVVTVVLHVVSFVHIYHDLGIGQAQCRFGDDTRANYSSRFLELQRACTSAPRQAVLCTFRERAPLSLETCTDWTWCGPNCAISDLSSAPWLAFWVCGFGALIAMVVWAQLAVASCQLRRLILPPLLSLHELAVEPEEDGAQVALKRRIRSLAHPHVIVGWTLVGCVWSTASIVSFGLQWPDLAQTLSTVSWIQGAAGLTMALGGSIVSLFNRR
jgi:hypothetical protein